MCTARAKRLSRIVAVLRFIFVTILAAHFADERDGGAYLLLQLPARWHALQARVSFLFQQVLQLALPVASCGHTDPGAVAAASTAAFESQVSMHTLVFSLPIAAGTAVDCVRRENNAIP